MPEKKGGGLSSGEEVARVSLDRAFEKAGLELRAKFPRKVSASDESRDVSLVAAEPLSLEEEQAVRQQFSKKPASPTEKPVVIIDAEEQEIAVPTAGDLHLPTNEKSSTNGKKDEEEKPLRGNRKRGEGRGRRKGAAQGGIQPTQEGEKMDRVDEDAYKPPEPPEITATSESKKTPKTRKKSAGVEKPPLKNGERAQADKKREEDRQSLIHQIQERDAKPRESAKFVELEPQDPDNEAGADNNSEQVETAVTERLKKAQEEVAEARRQFIREDFNKTSSWNKVKSFFRLKSEDSALGANSDVQSYQEIYKEKLLLFQDLQFQAIKESGVTGEAMKEAFALTLRYFKHDEAVRLYQARTDVRRENMHWGDRVASVFENIGKEYNKLSLTKKLAISAALIGGSFATGGASLLVKRLLSGAGTFVGVEGLLEKLAEKKESSSAQKEISEQIHGLDLSLLLDQKMLENYIKQDIDGLGSKLQKKKRDMLLRKGMALGIGVGIGSGAFSQLAMEHLGGKEALQTAGTYVMENLGGREALQTAGTYVEEVMDNVVGGGVPETVPAPAGSIEFTDTPSSESPISEEPTLDDPSQPAPGAADTQNAIGAPELPDAVPTEQENLIADIEKALASESGSGASSPATIEYTPEAREELAREVLLEDGGWNFLEDYNLTRADGPRGLWGVLESRLPADLPEAQKNAMVQKLENVIAERLAEMTPEQQAEAGFRSGDINRIYAGETIKFGAVLTPEDVENIVGGEALPGGGVITPDASEVPSSPGSGAADAIAPDNETPSTVESDGDVSGDSPEEVYNDNPVTADIQYERDIVFGKEYDLQSYKEYFRLHEDTLPLFRESGVEYMNFISQDNPAMMRNIGDKTFAALDTSAVQNTDLGKFITLAEKTYGDKLGVPSPKEKVYAYVMRMAMLSVEHPAGKRILLPKLFSV